MSYSTLRPSSKRIKRSLIKRSSKPMRKQSAHKAAEQRAWNRAVAARKADIGNVCEVGLPGCLGVAMHGHHKLKRRFSRNQVPVLVCERCHSLVEGNSDWARDHGWSVRGNGLPIQKGAEL